MFEKITSFSNLYAAAKAAARSKHDRKAVLRHDLHLEKILWRLQWQLRSGSYRHGGYYRFVVADPKPRDVSAAPFTDRIVHHAVVRVVEPVFDRSFIFDSYACRKGKGSHAAALRLQHFLRSALDKTPALYVLRADITKFFASIDQAVLGRLIAKKLRDNQALDLIHEIIASYTEKPLVATKIVGGGSLQEPIFTEDRSRPVGLPIGNLTSQLFANIYLNELDQFAKHTLRATYYVRYMDDFIILHPSKTTLKRALADIERFCAEHLRLQLHPGKTGIHKFHNRERFVGYDLAPFNRHLSKPTVKRFLRRLEIARDTKNTSDVSETWQQFQAYADFAHSEALLRSISPFGSNNDREGG